MSLKEEILDLLQKDREFRYAVAGLIGLEEILRRLDRHEEELVKLRQETIKILEEQAKLREEQTRLGEEQVKLREEQVRLREEQIRLREEQIRLREDMNRGFMLIERHITALGARWGVMSEEAFREGIKGLIEKEFGFKVEKLILYDKDGSVYGHPSQVDIDIAVHDEKIILIEVKSYARPSDVSIFMKKAQLYKELERKEPSKLIIVTPYAEDKALEVARNLGIEIYTKL